MVNQDSDILYRKTVKEEVVVTGSPLCHELALTVICLHVVVL